MRRGKREGHRNIETIKKGMGRERRGQAGMRKDEKVKQGQEEKEFSSPFGNVL